ncbi:MAG: PQQ-like beta-propeller repeat protein [Thermoplasmatales archaeon]|nr:MAG: PQQ-like beta-propeller repeat protein [Thermoplasmatales archaeon]
MKKIVIRKGIIIGIIVVFIIASFVSNISGDIREVSDASSNFEWHRTFLGGGPQEEWNKTFGGSSVDWGWSVQQTADGGYILTGETGSYGSGGFDAWLVKTDADGNEQWNKTFGGPAKDGGRSIQQTTDGGYVIGGYADSYGYPVHDVWLVKTDSNGDEEWNKTFGGPYSDGAFSVWQTNDKGYLAAGYSDSYGPGGHDVWLVKTDSNGDEEWNKTFGTSSWDTGYSVKQVNDGGYILIGATKSYGAGGQDVWLIKTDTNGVEKWNKTYGGSANDWGSSVCQTVDGGYILTGDTRSYGPGGYDIWLIKTDTDGNEQWNKIYGESSSDDTGYSIQQTTDGGYIVAGTKTSFQTDLTDIWLIKTDINGNMQWNMTIGGEDDDWGYSVDQTKDGAYVVTGFTTSYGSGSLDFWLIKVAGENQPPVSPIIEGPTRGKVGVKYEYNFSLSDPEDDLMHLKIDWGGGNITGWLGPYQSGQVIKINHTWFVVGDYDIKAKAKDIYGAESEWSDILIVTIVEGNPPNMPDMRGPTNGKPGMRYEYSLVSEDPDGDDIYYYIDWGDDNAEEWIGPYCSGKEITLNHTWSKKGKYTIKAKAKDPLDFESDWSILEVTMPKNKPFNLNFNLLGWLFDRLPHVFPILRHLLEL